MKRFISSLLVAMFVLAATCGMAQQPQKLNPQQEKKVEQLAKQRTAVMDGIVKLKPEQKKPINDAYKEYSRKELEAASKHGKGTPKYKEALAEAKKVQTRATNKTLNPEQLKRWQDHWKKK